MCSEEECLFENQGSDKGTVEGYAKLIGYYQKFTGTYFNHPVTCDAFVVTDGNQTLIDNLIEKIANGNTINSLTENNELLLKIPLKELNQNEQSIILNSSISNPVELKVIRKSPEGRAGMACEGFVKIISVSAL
jgi:hypothetical protein